MLLSEQQLSDIDDLMKKEFQKQKLPNSTELVLVPCTGIYHCLMTD